MLQGNYSQIRLSDIQDSIPSIKALLNEAVEILTDTQLRENLRQFSHTAGLCLKQYGQRYSRNAAASTFG